MTRGTFEFGSKIGFSSNIGTGNFKILSNALVQNPTGETVRLVSTSSNDSATGTGAKKVKITYFDNNWTLKSEIVSLNGTSSVNTNATDIFRIESFEVFQGSEFGTDGTITTKSTDGTKLFAQIDPNNTTFTRALHYVPPGVISHIEDILISSMTSGGIIFLVFITRDNTPLGNMIYIPDLAFSLANNTIQIPLKLPTITDASKSSQGLEVGIAVKGLAASQIASASFHFKDFLI